MKITNSFITVLFVLLTAQIASAYYCPSTGRWLSRDPIGESGLHALQATTVIPQIASSAFLSKSRWPSRDPVNEVGFKLPAVQGSNTKLAAENNLYEFAGNEPIFAVDRIGLDVWVIRDSSGWIRHRVAVGNNGDGTYWSSDFEPTSHNMILRANCQGVINFYMTSIFDPSNLGSDYEVERHIIADQSVTDKTRDYAKMRSNQADQPRYDACGNNCIDWAEGLARFTMGANLREKLDKIKNEKSKSAK